MFFRVFWNDFSKIVYFDGMVLSVVERKHALKARTGAGWELCATVMCSAIGTILGEHDPKLSWRILLTANPFTVNSDQQCFSHFFQFRASLIEISCTSHCRLTVYKCKPCQQRKTHLF